MPEGHTIHRLARQFNDVFAGQRLEAASPQGRFAAGAKRITGQELLQAEARGKQLFLHFDHQLTLRVHLGLYGAWDFGGDENFRGASSIGAPRRIGERELGAEAGEYSGPPAPVGAVRLRLVSQHGWADLRGPSVCELITESEFATQLAKLGPDPLAIEPESEAVFRETVMAKGTPIATLLMDQSVLAGVGNVYRAELLFRARLNPWLPGTKLSTGELTTLWADAVVLLERGVRDGRIITTEPEDRQRNETLHYVYKRNGLPCLKCGTVVELSEIAGRKLYYCPNCQRAN
ncbi:endonuclease-8/formamidopyrimidine-DNA glycosylase [Psychromicrobium silvestre]|uniref:DNA-(apurinic or apyrimidinic site) lyase n=1 Tax=Psychromicrobium silvestre TaxID=1645614 RepID=A0A7Y9LRZ9_9MICC|nr:Fpg/Nei family DNA glycosylase [Psychromicrobium silvestre]NYE94523.1 endonuclease-8/formamidopyrimidine-DNA glycosylase [Psychromicrobium silvestre]